jgi:molybdopterin-guanine dinucleotide biosynthesis protein A
MGLGRDNLSGVKILKEVQLRMAAKKWQDKVAEAVTAPTFNQDSLAKMEQKRPLKIFREALRIAQERHDPLWARVRKALRDALKELEWELGGDE